MILGCSCPPCSQQALCGCTPWHREAWATRSLSKAHRIPSAHRGGGTVAEGPIERQSFVSFRWTRPAFFPHCILFISFCWWHLWFDVVWFVGWLPMLVSFQIASLHQQDCTYTLSIHEILVSTMAGVSQNISFIQPQWAQWPLTLETI